MNVPKALPGIATFLVAVLSGAFTTLDVPHAPPNSTASAPSAEMPRASARGLVRGRRSAETLDPRAASRIGTARSFED
jgi:hypothetical protein